MLFRLVTLHEWSQMFVNIHEPSYVIVQRDRPLPGNVWSIVRCQAGLEISNADHIGGTSFAPGTIWVWQLLQKRIGSRKIWIALLLTLMKGEFKSPSEQVGGTQSIVGGD